ncbi:MAG TPA: hypothetical protein VGL81_05195 [Polyangiaceae bacterium]|jgi:hypothetical protein
MQLPWPARASLLGAILCVVAGCHGGGSSRLQGKWRGVRAEGVPGDTVAAANAFASGTEIDVKGDAITITTPKDKQSGRYKVVKQDKSTLTITTDKDGTDDPQTFTFVDDKTVRWAVLDGKSIVFAKQ